MTSRITEFEPPTRFVDEAESGPFARFRHEHTFDERGRTTTMTDVVDFALPFGPLGSVGALTIAGPYLRWLLRLRNRVIRREAEWSEGRSG